MVDPKLKISCTINALYGADTSQFMPKDITFQYSKTGRIRGVYDNDTLLCTLRVDGGLALSIPLAQMLLRSKQFAESCVEVSADAAPFVEEGRSVFAKHVMRCGKNVHVGSDTPVIHQGRVIAVGRARLDANMMTGFKRGVAVKVRKGLKRRKIVSVTC